MKEREEGERGTIESNGEQKSKLFLCCALPISFLFAAQLIRSEYAISGNSTSVALLVENGETG